MVISFPALFMVLYAQTIPAGTELAIRLQTQVSSTSRPGSSVEATLVQPVAAGGRECFAAGTALAGEVVDARRHTKQEGRAILRIDFSRIGAQPLQARLAAIDNARESVDESGVILGMRPLRAKPGKVEDVLLLAAHAHPVVLATMLAGKLVLSRAERPQVRYGPGVDMTLELTAPLNCDAAAAPAGVPPVTETPLLRQLIDSQPLRTRAQHPPDPSDITNLLFLGGHDELHQAFVEAGWMPAEAATLKTEAETFFAVADRHSFKQGPVSILLLDGRKPDLVFQKQNNTFAKRHHIRIWRRGDFEGRPVWVAAATHDIGIVFSREARTFTHKVEPDVDLERAKVLYDLLLTRRVMAASLVERPNAPRGFSNATGDRLKTDGAMAVMVLSSAR